MNSKEKLFDKFEIAALCQDLVRIKTVNPPGNEKVLIDYCKGYLRESGAELIEVPLSKGRSSLLAVWKGNPGGKQILFVGHADTVSPGDEKAWTHDPFAADLVDGVIYGRGIADMKGGTAAAMSALTQLKDMKHDTTFILAVTADEEDGCTGAESLLTEEYGLNPDLIIIPEPTGNQICVAEKGVIWVKLISSGKLAHGSMPDVGVNAVENMITLINQLDLDQFKTQNHPLLGKFSAALTTFNGGFKTNVIPDKCEAQFDIRTLPGQDHAQILAEFERVIDTLSQSNAGFDIRMEIVTGQPGVETDTSIPFILSVIENIRQTKADAEIVGMRYFSDGAVLVPALKSPIILLGPGEPEQAHVVDEHVFVDKLYESYQIFHHMVSKFS